MSSTGERDQAISLATLRPQGALVQARKVSEPWFRAQALSWVARVTDGSTKMRTFFELSPEASAAILSVLKGIPDIEHPVIAPVQDSRDAAKRKWGIGIYDKK